MSIKLSQKYFNPRSPRGGATCPYCADTDENIFQSTLPTRGSDPCCNSKSAQCFDFNPRSPRGGATNGERYYPIRSVISIHAPHEGERRAKSLTLTLMIIHFNPRSPRGGATQKYFLCFLMHGFQSTLPTRGSDCHHWRHHCHTNKFQSTLPTRGSDAHVETLGYSDIAISIHAPHEGERLC